MSLVAGVVAAEKKRVSLNHESLCNLMQPSKYLKQRIFFSWFCSSLTEDDSGTVT